jgi:hypothetical protein
LEQLDYLSAMSINWSSTASQKIEGNRLLSHLWVITVLVVLALRSWQYFADPSLFIDEIALARNIQDLSWPALLLGPLDYEQSAPPGFLALVKMAISLWGTSDLAFRLIPFAASIAGLLIFYRIAIFLPANSGLAALVLFALSPGIIRISSMVKPYFFERLII